MKIIQEDDNQMILKDRNYVSFIIGIIFSFLGLITIFKADLFTNQPPIWSGFVWVLLGFFAIIVSKITTITLDKSINKLLFFRKGLSGQSNHEYDLNQIKELELSVAYSQSKRKQGYSYHLAFIFNNGEIVPLSPGTSSNHRLMGRQIIPEKNIGARIASFLGVPFQERRPPTLSETLSTVSSAIQKAVEKEINEKQK
jgi:hypothetical protein